MSRFQRHENTVSGDIREIYLTVDVKVVLSFECDLTYLTAPENDLTLRAIRDIIFVLRHALTYQEERVSLGIEI